MSRHKENNPLSLPSQTRANGSVFGVSKPDPSSDFFTDSILEDTSKIPSPSPHKQPVTKPRRALAGNLNRPLHLSRGSVNTSHRSTSPTNANRPHPRAQRPAPLLSRPSFSSSQQDLITPPQSRDGPELKSPTSDVSSPPMALTDVYQRIADEERLAEREVDDDEDQDMYFQEGRRSPNIPRKSSSHRSLASKGSTPVRVLADSDKENAIDEKTGNLSEASGLSFAQGVTDPRLAVAMTPHFIEKAKDLRRLQNISNKPILFNQGPRPSEIAEDQRSTAGTERKSGGAPLARVHTAPAGAVNGTRATTRSPQLEDFEDESTSDELLDAEKEVKNRKLKRLLTHSRPVTGFAPAPIDRRHDDEHVSEDNETKRSVQSEPSVLVQHQGTSMPDKNPVPATAKGLLSMWSRKASDHKSQRQDSSQIDWAGVGADVPIPSVENSNEAQEPDSQSDLTGSIRSQRSIDRLWRLDNDFTGMSFQVSESPPVRSRKVEDYVRKQEIAYLSKKALTTSQLNAIREKDPREAHRRLSRSPSGGQLRPRQSVESMTSPQHHESTGQQAPDTPVVVYRSSTGSSSQESNHDRQSSHDHLQRLARAMSTTPKGSPVSAPTHEQNSNEAAARDMTQASCASSSNAPEVQPETSNKPEVLATPKVIGAWTDTVLPDTVRTVKTSRMPSRYAQTPHVSAGGWVDTPMQNGYRQSSALAPMIIEEVTEEVTADAAPQKGTDTQPAEINAKPPAQPKRTLPPSILSQVLEEEAFDFDIGETTLDSMYDLISETTTMLDNRKLTLQQQAASEAAAMLDKDELGFIDRLGGKLQEVAANLHDTRKGISHLEKIFIRASSAPTAASKDVNPPPIITKYQNSLVPVIYSTITFPIPLLFQPQPQSSRAQTQRNPLTAWLPFGKPTLLGWLVIAMWSWYILESFAAEVYSHPLQAEQYIWPPPDAPEPMFPYVLPTVILRGLGLAPSFGAASSTDGGDTGLGSIFWTILGPIFLLLRALYRVIAINLGLTDGFVDDFGNGAATAANNANAGSLMASATAAAAKGVKSAIANAVTSGMVAAGGGGGEDWNMMNDEFI